MNSQAQPSPDGDSPDAGFAGLSATRRVEVGLSQQLKTLARHLARDSLSHNSLDNSDATDVILRLPDIGDELFGFRLRRRLGKGAFASVFLAEQGDLAGRPVVLKVSAIEGSEPQTLAQLQHTHIVPIHSVHENPAVGLRAVCMPYFGGASLAEVLDAVFAAVPVPTKGQQLVAALEAVAPGAEQRPEVPGVASRKTGTQVLAGLDYARAAAWLIARLAEGLQHAHDRGVLHRDIKPSNVLLAGDGQPLLLDFNLSRDARLDTADATLGGTVAYMAPEHLRTLVSRSVTSVRQVDHRSDVYSLGMVLFEALTGHGPFVEEGSYCALPDKIQAMAQERGSVTPSLRERRPDVPWGLESIARKCLAPDPAQRYQQAEHLAEDLRRFLDDLPLRHAPELSRVERLRKWSRRHPRLTSAGVVAAVAAVLLSVAGGGLAAYRAGCGSTEAELSVSQGHERRRDFEARTVRALCLVNTTLAYQDNLRQGVEVCEQALGVYGLLDGPNWQGHVDWDRLAVEDRRLLAEDARELLLMLAGAKVRLRPGEKQALREALSLLERAESLSGLEPSKALWEDRAGYLQRLGEVKRARAAQKQADRTPAVSARDHYLLAAAYARQGGDGYVCAVAALDRAVQLNPRHYWSHYQRGLCHLEMGEHVPAAFDFGVAVGLWPESSGGHFNYAYALYQVGEHAKAVRHYDLAVQYDPELTAGYVNRGLAYLELQWFGQALADFDRAVGRGKDEAAVHAGRAMALEALGRHADADAAFGRAFARAEGQPAAARARLRWTYGFAVAARLPDRAEAAFAEVLRAEPGNAQALYGLAMLAMRQGRGDEARKQFDRAVQADPEFVEARRYRAVQLARLGRWEEARADAAWCVKRQPRGGATLYAAACVAALEAKGLGDERAGDEAADLLVRAAREGFSIEEAATDADLAAVRAHPRVRRLLASQRDK